MSPSQSPTALRRRLTSELRGLRAATHMTQRQVAEELAWSPSKLLRIENGTVGISKTDLAALLQLYGVRDRRRIDELTRVAQDARRQPPLSIAYRGLRSRELARIYELRKDALRIREFHPLFVPGPLQTEQYAREVIRVCAEPNVSAEDLERRLTIRMHDKDELLRRSDPPEMFFIVDEGSLRREVGGPKVMRGQLEEIRRLAARPKITVQMLPFTLGAYRGMTGPFQILEFDPTEDYLLYIEHSDGDLVSRDDVEKTTFYLEKFWELEELATKKWELDSFLDRVLQDMTPEEEGPVGRGV